MKLVKAKRQEVSLRIGLSGPSGFGKTYSALVMAYGITNDWNKIAVIDTENGSSNLYSHLGDFNVLVLKEPFNPERYIQAIKTCDESGVKVIIIDSITHEWQGKGGCLELHGKLGGRFQDWGKITPRHQAFVDSIINASCHVITTVRSKIDYSMDRGENGRTMVVKHGLKPITREGLDYELTVNFELINDKHLAKVGKDRTGLFMGKPEFVINSSTGNKLMSWCSQGISLENVKEEIQNASTIEGLKHLYSKYENFKKELSPMILKRKQVLERAVEQIIDTNQIEK